MANAISISNSRKAFLFTLGFLIITLAILSFARFVSFEAGNEKVIFQTAAVISRLDEADSSLQKCVKDAFVSYSNMDVYIDNHTLVIEEPLPNSIDSLEASLAVLKNFSEYSQEGLSIDLNDVFLQLPLFVMPQNIIYGHNFSSKQATISFPGQADAAASGYKATLTIAENVTCDWDYKKGDFDFELEIVSPDNSGCDQARSVKLDKDVSVTITSKVDPRNSITIDLDTSRFRIDMDDSSTFSVNLVNEIQLNTPPEDVWLGNRTIELSFDELNVKRAGGVRIV